MINNNRRKFVTFVGAGAVAVPVSALIGTLPSHAASHSDGEMINPEDPTAAALQYVVESEVDGANCATCALYNGDDKAGMCPLFQGVKVHATAWCSAYAPKA